MIRKTIITDFVYGKAIFQLPKEIIKTLGKRIDLKNINDQKLDPDLVEIYWGTRIKNLDIKKYKNLKWIHFGSIGTDKIKYSSLKDKKIIVTNSKAINSMSVAKLIFIYLLDIEKKILKLNNFSNRDNYEKKIQNNLNLSHEKILILGYGSIAKKINILTSQLKLNIDFYSSRSSLLKKKNILNYKQSIKKLNKYKVIINLLKYNDRNKNFMNKNFIKKLNKFVNLILVGRLETIDLKYLNNFLTKNKKSFAYMDAQSNILNKDIFNKIKKLNNLFLTPHIGGYYNDYWTDQYELFNQNLIKYLNGKKLKNIVKIEKNNFS
ncbi:hypothetical protein OAD13_04405 [Candidatus Pelagibacter sp.]|nr:hypothetical protein [Candidatus Pelagibacter sp.]